MRERERLSVEDWFEGDTESIIYFQVDRGE